MLDEMVDYLEQVRDRPVWKAMPDEARRRLGQELPKGPTRLDDVYDEFRQTILPYALGNVHPGFMGWVHGAGTPVGMLAELLAAALNSNVGGRDHSAIEVERQIVQWVREIFEFPPTAGGLFVTGSSMANLLGILMAKTRALGSTSRVSGLGTDGARLRAYTSQAAHRCVGGAMEIVGLGSNSLRKITMDSSQRMNTNALAQSIREDRERGLLPFVVVATAGTVDVGAIDDLAGIGEICRENGIWFHVDGAFGALAKLSAELAPRLAGIETADSLAFDFHKWGQVQYDAGFILARDQAHQLDAFASEAVYLRREQSGMAAGSPWPCDLGPDLSRGFRALKTWFTLKTLGPGQIGSAIDHCCQVARHLEARVRAEPLLELLAPAQLNIVCYRFSGPDPDRFNSALAIAIQESGIAAPSTTIIDGHIAIRAAIVNHRTLPSDVDALIDTTLELAARMLAA
jgi:glutamate/tyrosine decarboxylase-like PLP-dependent enzyme